LSRTVALPAAPGWLTLIVSTTLRIRLAARLAALVGLRRILTVPARAYTPVSADPRLARYRGRVIQNETGMYRLAQDGQGNGKTPEPADVRR